MFSCSKAKQQYAQIVKIDGLSVLKTPSLQSSSQLLRMFLEDFKYFIDQMESCQTSSGQEHVAYDQVVCFHHACCF